MTNISEVRPEPRTDHLNLRWSIADVRRVEEMAKVGNDVDHIAFVMGATRREVLQLLGDAKIHIRRSAP